MVSRASRSVQQRYLPPRRPTLHHPPCPAALLFSHLVFVCPDAVLIPQAGRSSSSRYLSYCSTRCCCMRVVSTHVGWGVAGWGGSGRGLLCGAWRGVVAGWAVACGLSDTLFMYLSHGAVRLCIYHRASLPASPTSLPAHRPSPACFSSFH